MAVELTDSEIRVLGVLVEKSLTQPSSYPLTLNSITLGSNQLQNRDPVVNLAESDVSAALRTLMHKKLVEQAPPSSGARAVRFRHKAPEVFLWDKRQQAVMTELMLRGRQTAGELRSRASRMTPFQDVDSVSVTLQELKTTAPPYVRELPREPGRSANRFRHLLAAAGEAEIVELSSAAPQRPVAPLTRSSPSDTDLDEWKARLTALEERVEVLGRIVDELQAPPRSEEPEG